MNTTHRPHRIAIIALIALLAGAQASAQTPAPKPAPRAKAELPTRRVIIQLDAQGREIVRDTVTVDPNEEAQRRLAERARALSEEARELAEQAREQALRQRERADSLREDVRIEIADAEMEHALRESMREMERASRALEREIRGNIRVYPDRLIELDVPRPPRPARAPRGWGNSPRKRIWIQAGPETDVDEKDLSNDSVEVRQYTIRRKKGASGSGYDVWGDEGYALMPPSPLAPLSPGPLAKLDMSIVATLDITKGAKGDVATARVKLASGEHRITVTDASGKQLLEEKVTGAGRFEREIKLPAGTKRPLTLNVKQTNGSSSSSITVVED